MKTLGANLVRPFIVALGFWLAAPLPIHSQSYTWSTALGWVGAAASVDGTNNRAGLYYPDAIAIAAGGGLYLGDYVSIRRVLPVGTNWFVRTLAGGHGGTADGTNGAAQFYYPAGIAVDRATNIYVTDFENNTIRKVTPFGTNWVVTTIAGLATSTGSADGTNSDARFFRPCGIAVDPTGALFVSDYVNATIRKIVPVGTNWVVSTVAGLAGSPGTADGTNSDARFAGPQGIALDTAANLYVADSSGAAIRKVTLLQSNCVVTTIAGLGRTTGYSDGTNSDARFYLPTGIAVGSDGSLYVTDTQNELIRKITPVGTNWVVTTIGGHPFHAGSQDGVGTNASFFDPLDIAVDANDNLYVADYRNDTLRFGLAALANVPSLRIDASGEQTVISWSLAATNYMLETSPLLFPGTTWTRITNGVQQTGPSFIFATNFTRASSFYRLHAQN